MKKISLMGLLFAALAVTFQSCKDETVLPSPSVNFKGGTVPNAGGATYVAGNVTVKGGDSLFFGINASHSVNMTKISATVSYNGGPATGPFIFSNGTSSDSTVNTQNLNFDKKVFTQGVSGTEKWTITVTDKEGMSSSVSFTVTTTDPGGPALTTVNIAGGNPPRAWNFIGPNTGAWDLQDDAPAASNDDNAIKDIQDSTKVGDPNNWGKRWTTRNGTRFIKVTGSSLTYANATQEKQLSSYWTQNAGMATSLLENIKAGDVYLARLRNTDVYVLIKINSVVETTTDNKDYIEFEYKKVM